MYKQREWGIYHFFSFFLHFCETVQALYFFFSLFASLLNNIYLLSFFFFLLFFYVRVGRGVHIWVTGHLWNWRSYILLGIVEWHGAVWIMSVHWLLLRSWLYVEPYVIEKTR